jgi:glycosyltransferase involved in cell wall biosynthesis
MRILAICHWNLANPDAETIRKIDLNAALSEAGVDSTLFAPNLGRYPHPTPFPIHYIPSLGGRIAAHSYILGLFVPLLLFLIVRRPKLVYVTDYTFSFPLLALLWLLRIPVIVEVNGVMAKDAWSLGIRDPVRLTIIKLLSSAGLRSASKLICVSEDVRGYLVDELNIPSATVTIVPNGVNTDLYRPLSQRECRQRLGIDEHELVIGFIGSFFPWQGVEQALRAVKEIVHEPAVHFYIVGYGPLEERYRALIEELGISKLVTLVGKVSLAHSPLWINSFDLGVHLVEPGKACSPVKLQCYMACSCPALVTHGVDGFELIQADNYGRKVSYDSISDIGQAMIDLLTDPMLRQRMGQRARDHIVESSSWRQRALETSQVLDSV